MARNCYQEVQLLAPQSSYAEKAAAGMEELTCTDREHNLKTFIGTGGVDSFLSAFSPLQPPWPRLRQIVFEEQETQSPADWWQERFLKAAREIRGERLRNDPNCPCPYFHGQPETRIVPESRLYERTPVQLLEELEVKRAESARKMYHKGEHARQAGDMAKALHYFKAAHGTCPTCAFGERALKHIFAIENSLLPRERGIGEESETPPLTSRPLATPPLATPPSPPPAPPTPPRGRSPVLEGTVPLEIYLDPMDGKQLIWRVWGSDWSGSFLADSQPGTFGMQEWVQIDPKPRQMRIIIEWTQTITSTHAPAAWRAPFDVPAIYLEMVGNGDGWRLNTYVPGDIRTCLRSEAEANSSLIDTILGNPWQSREVWEITRWQFGPGIEFYPPSGIFGDEETAPPAIQPQPLRTRLRDAARRLLDALCIDIDTDSDQSVRIAINLCGQHYLFHYRGGALLIFASP